MHARLLRAALALSTFVAATGCTPSRDGGASDLPSPRAAAELPLSDFAPSATGPGLGAELVFTRGASLSGDSLTLDAENVDGPSLAIVRWLGITPGLVSDVAFTTPPSGVELATASSGAGRWSFEETAPALDAWEEDGVLLLAARNASSSAATIDLALTFAIPASLPDWQPADNFPVPELPEPSGIDYDFKRDRLWVVEDGGRLGRVDPDGGAVEAFVELGGDLEAVRWVPGLDVLLAVNEVTSEILAISPESMAILATASLVFSSNATPSPTTGGDGIEGLAVTGLTDRTVHLVLANQNDPHCLYVADLTLPDPIAGTLTATVLAAYPQPAENLSEVMLDWGSRRLFNLHGYGNDRLVPLDPLFIEMSESSALPFSAEGGSLREGSLVTTQDLGGISLGSHDE